MYTNNYSPGGVNQRVPRLVLVRRRRTDVRDHDGPAVAAQRLAQQPGEFAVAVVDESRVRAAAQRVYTVSQRQKRPVDVRPFFQPFPSVLKPANRPLDSSPYSKRPLLYVYHTHWLIIIFEILIAG